MKTTLIAAFAVGTASVSAAVAGGYVAPVVDTPPVVVAPVAAPTNDWTGFYGGLQFGRADVEIDDADFDDNENYYGLHAGYLHDFGQFVGGAELSYDKLGDYEVFGSGEGDYDGDLIRAKLLAGYDAGRFLPYAAISLGHLSMDGPAFDESDTAFGYGVGVKYMVTPRFLVGAEWMKNDFEIDVDDLATDVDVSTFGVNASFKF